jgi:hypothetical protein
MYQFFIFVDVVELNFVNAVSGEVIQSRIGRKDSSR